MFTARYGLGPYITQIRFVLKGLIVRVKDSVYLQTRLDKLTVG